MTDASPAPRAIAALPVGLFGSVMGLGGLAIAWSRAADLWGVSRAPGVILTWAAVAALAALTAAYVVKVAAAPRAVAAEWSDPVRLAFGATSTVALLVAAVPLYAVAPTVAEGMWWVGAVSHTVVTVGAVRMWIGSPRVGLEHVHPGWFVPVVGNIIVPVVGVHFAPAELNWYFFAVGLLWWAGLLPVVLTRLITGPALPPALVPTLAVLISPPAVGSVAWVALGGRWGDAVSSVLLGLAVFQGMLLGSQFPQLRRAPFGPSAWAYTFPVGALAGALLASADATACRACGWLGGVVLTVATVVVGWALVRTVAALVSGALLSPAPAREPAAAPPGR